MSPSNGSVVDSPDKHSGRHSHHGYSKNRCCSKGNWSGINIAAMVIAFVLFWPLGLVVLYWNISGRDIKELPDAIKEKWESIMNGCCQRKDSLQSDNVVFDEYQQTQFDRIREIKEEIKSRARRFNVFRSEAKRRQDEKEFKDFMAKNPDD